MNQKCNSSDYALYKCDKNPERFTTQRQNKSTPKTSDIKFSNLFGVPAITI